MADVRLLNNSTDNKDWTWTCRLEELVSGCQDVPGDVREALYRELFPVFITCLQQDSRPAWRFLTECLDLIKSYKTNIVHDDTRLEVGGSMVWYLSLPLMSSFNYTEAVKFPVQAMFPEDILFLRIIDTDMKKKWISFAKNLINLISWLTKYCNGKNSLSKFNGVL